MKATAKITYGGTAAAYAAIVHETHSSQSKYLEAPAREAASRLREAARKRVKGATR